jgi:hypothetical protein
VVALVPVLIILYLVIRATASRTGLNMQFEWKPDSGSTAAGWTSFAEPSAPRPATMDAPAAAAEQSSDPRRLLANIYRIMTLVLATAALIGAIVAFYVATPANGLLLVAMLLLGLSIIAFLSADKYTRAYREEESDRNPFDDLRRNVKVATVHAPPKVHVMDNDAVARARAMSQQGVSLDAICRAVDHDYAKWAPAQQQAFRQVMQAMLKA